MREGRKIRTAVGMVRRANGRRRGRSGKRTVFQRGGRCAIRAGSRSCIVIVVIVMIDRAMLSLAVRGDKEAAMGMAFLFRRASLCS
jgi:hypothetical protein